MKYFLHLVGFILQLAITFLVLFITYMLFALFDTDFGVEGIFGIIIIQPIFAVILASFTILFCLLIGLPLRFIPKLKNWLRRNPSIFLVGFLMGVLLLFFANSSFLRETVSFELDEEIQYKKIPNILSAFLGWFIMSFSMLHVYLPNFILDKILRLFQKY